MRSSIYLSGVALMALAPIEYAQAQDATISPSASADAATGLDDQSGGLQDIVVTAQRRSERMQDVPIAISAVTAATLETSGVKGLDTLQMAVPSLSVQNSSGALTLRIRGLGAIFGGPGFEPPVALYVDGQYYGTQFGGLMQFNNIERVEVLKGPQGTLFGRNATGGLVQIITKDPGSKPELKGSMSYGNYNAVEGQIYASTPLGPDLAADIAGSFSRHDGWGINEFTGNDSYKVDFDIGFRSKIVWTPGDFKFTLIGDYTNRKNNMAWLTGSEGSVLSPGQPPVRYSNPWNTNTDAEPKLHQRNGGISLKVERPLGDITLSNHAVYRFSHFTIAPFELEGSPAPIVKVDEDIKDRQFTNELQLSSSGDGRFKWVAGAFYYWSKSNTGDPLTINFSNDPNFNPNLNTPFPLLKVITTGGQRVESISGYAQGDLELIDRLTLTLGARYTYEKRKFTGGSLGELLLPGNPQIPLIPTVNDQKSVSRPTFRAALNYKFTDDIMGYVSVNTGFKSGGYNVFAPDFPFYKPEKITAYEIGQKADLFDRTVRLNTSVFYYDYKNVQTQRVTAAATGLINGAKARIYGLDSDITIVPTPNLQINGGLSLLHTEYLSFPLAPVGQPGGGGIPLVDGDVSGNHLNYSPDMTFSLGATWTVPVGENELIANANWLHSEHYFHEADNVAREPAFDKINASLTYNIDNGRISIAGYVNNLTDEAVRAVVLTSTTGQQLQIMQAPRTYGVRIGFKM